MITEYSDAFRKFKVLGCDNDGGLTTDDTQNSVILVFGISPIVLLAMKASLHRIDLPLIETVCFPVGPMGYVFLRYINQQYEAIQTSTHGYHPPLNDDDRSHDSPDSASQWNADLRLLLPDCLGLAKLATHLTTIQLLLPCMAIKLRQQSTLLAGYSFLVKHTIFAVKYL